MTRQELISLLTATRDAMASTTVLLDMVLKTEETGTSETAAETSTEPPTPETCTHPLSARVAIPTMGKLGRQLCGVCHREL